MATNNSGNTNAQQVVVNISANTSGFTQAVQTAQQSLQGLQNTNVANNSIASLRQQLRDATNEALRLQQAGQGNTAAYRQAAQTIADLRDQQELLNRTVSAFDPGNKFNAMIGIAKSAATGLQGVAGAMTVMGVNAETANEAIAKLQGIMAMTDAINAIGDLQDFWKGWLLTLRGGTATTQANTTATQAQTAATTAQTAATTGASTASKALGAAMKAIPILLLISAVSYLVSNWDSLKKSITNLLPGMDKAGETFNKVKNIVLGVGNVVVQFLIAPIKAFVALINRDLKGAVDALKNGVDGVQNFKAGQRQGELNDQKAHNKELIQQAIDNYKVVSARRKANGQETYDIDKKTKQLELSLLDSTSKEGKEKREEIYTDELAHNKKLNDEKEKSAKEVASKAEAAAKQAREKSAADKKANLEEVRKLDEEFDKEARQRNLDARAKELDELKTNYETKLKVYKKYGSDSTKLTEDYKLDQADIEKKYNDIINQGITEAENKNLEVYEQKKLEINKKIDDLLKNANDEQKKRLEEIRASQLGDVNKEQQLNTVSVKANVNLTTTTSENTISDADTPEQRYNKTLAVLAAKRQAEIDSFNLELDQKKNEKLALEQIEADHKAALKSLDDEEIKAKKEKADSEKAINQAAMESRMNQLNTVGNALGSFAQLAGEQTVAGKALAVSQATISAITGAVQSFTSMSSIPIVGPALGAVAAAGALAAGYANVKKILAVKVPGKSSGGGSLSAPNLSSVTAPTVSANDLNPNITQDVRVTNSDDQVVRAYIVDKDLKDNEDRTSFMNKLSEI